MSDFSEITKQLITRITEIVNSDAKNEEIEESVLKVLREVFMKILGGNGGG